MKMRARRAGQESCEVLTPAGSLRPWCFLVSRMLDSNGAAGFPCLFTPRRIQD